MDKPSKAPQPKWFVLKTLNYFVLAVFVGSITFTALNYRRLSADTDGGMLTSLLFPLMVLWSLCLAYFFGFFGISLVDTDALARHPVSDCGVGGADANAAALRCKRAAAAARAASSESNTCNTRTNEADWS